MRSLLFACLLSLLPVFGMSQNYSISTIPFNPDPYTGNQILVNLDDVHSYVIQLPFSFCFYGNSYDHVVVSSNGYVTFDTLVANNYSPWPINSAAPNLPGFPYPSILAPWHDIDPSITGSVFVNSAGVAPYRRFIISYDSASMYSSACNSMLFTQQIILYETTNIIETHIENKPLCTSWNGGAAIHGLLEDLTNAHIVPGRNFPTQWSTSNEGMRFTPNGTCSGPSPANVISGKVYVDNNNNCTFDGGDVPISNRSILVNGGQYYAWTDILGDYSVDLDTGTWTVNHVAPPFFANACAPSTGYTHTFTTQGNTAANNDFADSLLVNCPDMRVAIGMVNMSSCRTESAALGVWNNGPVTDSNVVVTLTLIDSVQLDTAAYPYTQTGPNTYTFALGTFTPGQYVTIPIRLDIGCDTLGTVYCIEAEVAGTVPGDCDTTNNYHQNCQPLVGSYDPNDKTVASRDFANKGWVSSEDIEATDELTYRVRFQNTGNDTALYVRIEDTLSAFLDPTTVQFGASSHFYNATVIGDVIIIEFNDIELPDSLTDPVGSQGFVKFSVKQIPGNQPGTQIENEASIYFDFNAPILTNATVNTIEVIVGTGHTYFNPITVYPNPGRDRVKFTWSKNSPHPGDYVLTLRDLMGKTVKQKRSEEALIEVDTQDLATGSYIYEIRENGSILGTGLWIKE